MSISNKDRITTNVNTISILTLGMQIMRNMKVCKWKYMDMNKHYNTTNLTVHISKWIGVVMVFVLAWSVVDHWLDYPGGGGGLKPKIRKSICVVSPLITGWLALGIRILCPSRATCLPGDCCFQWTSPVMIQLSMVV